MASKKNFFSKQSKHMMTGVSYMIPVIVMGGLLQSIGLMIGGATVAEQVDTIQYFIFTAGQTAMNLVVPVLAAYIAFSIADRPGIAPGLLVGALSVNMKIGFIGGIIGGYLVGYFVNFVKEKLKVPTPVKPLMPLLILPILGGLFAMLLMNVLIGPSLSGLQLYLIEVFRTMEVGSRFVFGALLGGLTGVDMGGPISKIGTTVANGLMADGIFGPEGAKICFAMVPPLAMGISSLISKKKYTKQEQSQSIGTVVLGLFQVSEGGLPYLLRDPLRIIPCTVIGSALTGGLAMLFNVESPVTMGGIAIFPVMTNVPGAIISIAAGVAVTVILLQLFKKDVTVEEDGDGDASDEELEVNIEF